jgi:hypothetical protein
MRRLVLLAIAAALLWAPTAHAATVMVVGRGDALLFGPRQVAAAKRSIDVGRHRCTVGAGTPLSLLLGTRLRLDARDEGACGRSPASAGAIYVEAVSGQRERGLGGWVYKVGHVIGTTGAGDPSGPFGTGRLVGRRARLLWFWCVRAGDCQRTLEVRAADGIGRGKMLRVTVRAYDDFGRRVPARGATVRFGPSSATTDRAGVATLPAPSAAGRYRVAATHPGMVRSFPVGVRVR